MTESENRIFDPGIDDKSSESEVEENSTRDEEGGAVGFMDWDEVPAWSRWYWTDLYNLSKGKK